MEDLVRAAYRDMVLATQAIAVTACHLGFTRVVYLLSDMALAVAQAFPDVMYHRRSRESAFILITAEMA
jgi:hypothetical protein